MHEFSIVESLLKAAIEVSEAHGGLRIRRIGVEIGVLRQVMPEALGFAFEAATRETPAEGAHLDWVEIQAKVRCPSCGETYGPEDRFWVCPVCGAPGGQVIEGDDLVLTCVELEEPH